MLKVQDFTLVHATLDQPGQWDYVFNKLDAAASFPYQDTHLCFFGHTHVPLAFVHEQTSTGQPVIKGGTHSRFKVDPNKKYFINVGSAGRPRDNNPKAAYVVYDTDNSTVELRRLEYDIAATQKKMREAGLSGESL